MGNPIPTTPPDYQMYSVNTAAEYTIDLHLQRADSIGSMVTAIKIMKECSAMTGDYVKFLPEMSYAPVLIGADQQPVFLYQLVEVLEGYLDFDGILAEFPTLNFSQIAGALSYLRKVGQLNTRLIDIDALEDELEDPDFIDTLKEAYENRGNEVRVLTDNV